MLKQCSFKAFEATCHLVKCLLQNAVWCLLFSINFV